MKRQKELSKDDVRRLVFNCFHDLAAEVDDGWVPKTLQPDEERHRDPYGAYCEHCGEVSIEEVVLQDGQGA